MRTQAGGLKRVRAVCGNARAEVISGIGIVCGLKSYETVL